MKTFVAEFPKHPLPQIPQPQPQQLRVQPPTVFVYEQQQWEYRVVTSTVGKSTPSQADMNALGRDGWELVGVVQQRRKVQFFFKRAKL